LNDSELGAGIVSVTVTRNSNVGMYGRVPSDTPRP
jgi:hypothetical protein